MSSRQSRVSKAAANTNAGNAVDGRRSAAIVAISLGVLFVLSLFLRVYPGYGNVFSQEGIKFTNTDSYFFMRILDNLAYNFPHVTAIDPYLVYPFNSSNVEIRFFTWLLAVPAWIAGLGSPSQHTIDLIAVYIPAVMGAMMVIPVYFIGKTLFSRLAGVLSAALIAVMPGEFIGRSFLGFVDNHIAETFLATITMLFLILAVKSANQRQLAFNCFKRRDYAAIRKPLIYSLLAAFFMGLYIFTWTGALLFIFIVFLYFVIQFVIDHWKQKSIEYLGIVGVFFFTAAMLMALWVSSSQLYLAALFVAILAIPALSMLSNFFRTRKIKPVLYPILIIGFAVVAVVIIYLVNRNLYVSMVDAFRIFRPSGTDLTTVEMQPLISGIQGNPLTIAWGNFNISLYLSIISLGIMVYLVLKQDIPEKSLFVVWSLVALAATLGQRRFAYYLAVNISLLTGYLSWKVIEIAGLKKLIEERTKTKARVAGKRNQRTAGVASYYVVALAVLVFLGIFTLNIGPAINETRATPFVPSDAWVGSLNWLRENSPEPFGDPEFYYRMHVNNASQPGDSYRFPASAYGVLSWWDYGYWITRIAHRIPNSNPSQDPVTIKNVAQFFITQSEPEAADIQKKLDSKYVVIDDKTAISKLWAIITWAGEQPSSYFDIYLMPLQQQERQSQTAYKQAMLFYPEYYRSMAVRLFNFDGKAVTPDKVTAISYQERKDTTGIMFKVISDLKEFTTFDEAQTYISGNTTGNWKIIGTNPMKSAVPLDALTEYSLVHASEQLSTLQDGIIAPSVKIFQYTKK